MLKKWFFLGLVIFGFLCADYAYITMSGPRQPINVEFEDGSHNPGQPMDNISEAESESLNLSARRKVASTGKQKKDKKSRDIPWGRVSHTVEK